MCLLLTYLVYLNCVVLLGTRNRQPATCRVSPPCRPAAHEQSPATSRRKTFNAHRRECRSPMHAVEAQALQPTPPPGHLNSNTENDSHRRQGGRCVRLGGCPRAVATPARLPATVRQLPGVILRVRARARVCVPRCNYGCDTPTTTLMS